MYVYIYIYIYRFSEKQDWHNIYNHKYNVSSQLPQQWLCGSSCTWPYVYVGHFVDVIIAILCLIVCSMIIGRYGEI